MNGDFFVRSVDASTNRGHEYVNSVSADTYMSGWLMAAFGPECVKTLLYLGYLSPAQLGESIAQAFATISTGNAPGRL